MKTRKIKCKLSKKELENLYINQQMTQVELCKILGVKSYITVRRILHEYGIDTNKNKMRSNITKKGMSDDEFKNYLEKLYNNELLSINEIARKLNVCQNAIRRYFEKYNIKFRDTSEAKTIAESGNRNPNWRGGRSTKSNGYIEVYIPKHPNCNSRGCVYEHRLVMEKQIGRYLTKDEVVHHIDFNKQNNDISNLMLMTPKEHKRFHNLIDAPRKKKEVV